MILSRTFRKHNSTILEGPLFGKILLFVIPLMLTNLLQVCYSAADMIVVGYSNVPGALGAIGTTTALINFFVNLFMGFSVGTTVVVAQNIGADNKQATENAVHSSLIISVIAGAICGLLGVLASPTILTFLGDEGHILELAALYTRINFIGAPITSLSNSLIAIFRAKGDTKTPLLVLSLSGLLNVGLNLFFVLVLGMSVDGVAIATVMATLIGAILLLIKLRNLQDWCRFDPKKLKLHKDSVISIIKQGLPASLQGMVFSISNMLIQSSVITMNSILCPGGSAVIDGNSAGHSIEQFSYNACNSVYQASVTFTSQHYGAKKYRRIGKVMLNCYLITTCIALIFGMCTVLFRDTLLSFYVSDPLALKTASIRFMIMNAPYFLLAWMECGSGALRGMGKSMTSTIISLTGSCLLRVCWVLFVFPQFHTLASVYMSYPITWSLTALAHFTFSMVTRRKLIRENPGCE